MRSHLWIYGFVILASAILGLMMAQQFSVTLYVMVIIGSILLGFVAARA